jgi:predicted transcriptional regulator
MADEQLITLTADIVAAHVANNNVAVGDVANLVQQVHTALAKLGEPQAAPEPEAKKPVVSVRSSVKPDFIVCMECGSKQKMLKRHLQTAHSMSPDQYRQDYGLPKDYPMVAPNYSEQRRALANSIGLGRKKGEPAKGKRARTPKGGSTPPAE